MLQRWRTHILFYSIILMLIFLFTSRSLLALAIIPFVFASFLNGNISDQLRNFLHTPLLWGMSLLFFLPLLSGIWSEDKSQWLDIIRTKLPLLFLPLAFAGAIRFSRVSWNTIGVFFILLMVAGSVWSMIHYSADPGSVNKGYLQSKVLITPLQNDHVRFSWMVNIAIICCGYIYYMNRKQKLSFILLVLGAWMIIFLHILVARTGLITFYCCLLLFALWLLWKKLRWYYAILVLVALISFPLIAYNIFPSFQNRVKYFRYEMEYMEKEHYLPGSNDGVRFLSMKAGLNVWKENKITGVGFGDIKINVNTWYKAYNPAVLESDQIYPSSEILIYAAGGGILGILVFTFAVLIPFFQRTGVTILWWMLNVSVLLSLFSDVGLEIQFGVFIYSFFVLWWWKWLNA